MDSTWTLVLSALVFPLIVAVAGFFLKRTISKSFKGWEKYENLRDSVLKEWQSSTQQTLCRLKNALEEIEDAADKMNNHLTQVDERLHSTAKQVDELRGNVKDIYDIINRRKVER